MFVEDSALNTTQVTEAEAVRKPGSKKRSVSVPVARQNVSKPNEYERCKSYNLDC